MFVALRPGGVRRRLRLAGLLSLPLLALYVAVGEQQTSRIFAPVHALNTIWGDTADDSTLSRRIEDAGLVSTLAGNPLFGTGWGHEYKEIDTRYAPELIKRFPQYRYIPHNSMLGLAAFSGWLGFSLTWALVPVTLYLAVRTHRQAATPTEAQAGLFVAGLLPVYAVQAWADMGLQSLTAAVFLGSCVAVAGRLSVASGAWPGRRRAAPRRAAPGADPTLSPAA